MKTKAIFLDRDGVINKLIMRDGKGRAPYSIEDLEIFPGVAEAISKFKMAGYLVIVVTNQPDVARGWVGEDRVHLINNKIKEQLLIDDIKICFHDNSSLCECRKPMPGMLLSAARDWNIDLSKSFMVGDRFGDVSAGVRAGCKTILVGIGDIQGEHPSPDYQVESLFDGAQKILSHF